jgi:hypothetical protein
MKNIQLLQVKTIAVAVFLAGATGASAQNLPIYTIIEGPTGLSTTIPGATISGTQDDWTLTLAGGDFWATQTTLFLAEPESAISMNILSFPTANTLTWQSDVTANGLTGLPALVSDDVLLATGGPLGIVNCTDIGDTKGTVPDGGATFSLLGTGLAGLLALRRRLSR